MKIQAFFFSLLATAGILFSSCRSIPYTLDRDIPLQKFALPPDSLTGQRILLLGDAGSPDTSGNDRVFLMARRFAKAAGKQATLVFLGDNLYPDGLPAPGEKGEYHALTRLKTQLAYVKDLEAPIFYVPGNHDWASGGPEGYSRLLRQQQFLDSLSGGKVQFAPRNGFPGPYDVEIDEDNVLIFLDTQWWLHRYEKPSGFDGENTINEPGQILVQFEDLLLKNASKNVIVIGHHPLLSNGEHAGFFSLKTHLFPLTKLHPSAWIPLPVAGSLYPMAVRFIGGPQDLAHPRYQQLRKGLMNAAISHERLIYAAGHDHSLQYKTYTEPERQTIHHITSGSASKTDYVAAGQEAIFTASRRGFMELRLLKTGAVWLLAWQANRDGKTETLLYRKEILTGFKNTAADTVKVVNRQPARYKDSLVVRPINARYGTKTISDAVAGSGYRSLWAEPVPFPVLDIGVENGGMIPLKRGGGMQTVNIRMLDASGRQWALRSIDKDASISIPWYLKQTVALDALQDQVSSLHPYGSLVIPVLSKAAGIRHTNPRFFYVPDDPRFGQYRTVVANTVMMLEERPDDLHAGSESFGFADEVVGADKLYENIMEDNDHQVDQRAYAKARFFDIWIGDWDRHRNQWSWSKYKSKKRGTLYRPIPRDRDFAFFHFEGPVQRLATLYEPKYASFGPRIKSFEGLTKSGFDQDRRFMNSLSLTDWLEIADSLLYSLSDAVIDSAMRALPVPVYEKNSTSLSSALKSRRQDLKKVVSNWYHRNNVVVDITGTSKHERFEILFHPKDSVQVTVYKTGREGDIRKTLYRRTFYHHETQEIRLYGMAGNDRFFISGATSNPVRLRIIGGAGEDLFKVNESKNFSGTVKVYDTRSSTTLDGKGRISTELSENPLINEYRFNGGFKHNGRNGLAFFDYNVDDGLFVGGGMKFIRHSFRQFPYNSEHRIKANVASKTLGYNVKYSGHYRNLFKPFDFYTEAEWLSPTNILNFYGFGNESKPDEDARFYQAQLQQAMLAASLYKVDLKGNEFKFGPVIRMIRIRNDVGKFLREDDPAVQQFDLYDDQSFAGIQFVSTFHNLTNLVNPKSGFKWLNGAEITGSLKNEQTRLLRLYTDLALYASPLLSPQVTWANRIGGARNIGDFPFYNANTLGGTTNLRGFRGNRFTGRSSIYVNSELRFRLADVRSYFMIGELGGLVFGDAGRVWDYDQDNSSLIHKGYGGGLWFNFLDLFLISATVGRSEDGVFFNSRVGFQF